MHFVYEHSKTKLTLIIVMCCNNNFILIYLKLYNFIKVNIWGFIYKYLFVLIIVWIL